MAKPVDIPELARQIYGERFPQKIFEPFTRCAASSRFRAVRLSSTRRRRAEACIANDDRHFEHFFDVSFYAFTHNYSLFTLLFSIFLCLFFTLQILSKIHDETQKTLTIKTKITSNDRKI
jgi:hypothetical protein